MLPPPSDLWFRVAGGLLGAETASTLLTGGAPVAGLPHNQNRVVSVSDPC